MFGPRNGKEGVHPDGCGLALISNGWSAFFRARIALQPAFNRLKRGAVSFGWKSQGRRADLERLQPSSELAGGRVPPSFLDQCAAPQRSWLSVPLCT